MPRTTFQLAASLTVPEGCRRDEAYRKAVDCALDWLQSKYPNQLPSFAREPKSFDLDEHGQQRLQAVYIPGDGLWSARLIHPDAPFAGRPAVAGRTWTTEIALLHGQENLKFAVRVSCVSAPYATEPFALTRPQIVVRLARQFDLRELRPLDGRPWLLQSKDELEELHGLLTNPHRTLPVVLLTEPNPQDWPGRVAPYVLDHEELAQRTQGFAHVVCMPRNLGFAWTDRVGKIWSAFWGAVRTYYPGLDFENDSPTWHPRVLPDRIVFWRYDGLEAEAAFASFLIDKLAAHAASKSIDWAGCLFFADARVRQAALARERLLGAFEEQRRNSADEISFLRTRLEEVEKVYDEEIAFLEEKVKSLTEERDVALRLGEAAESESRRLTEEYRKLQFQNDALRAQLKRKTGLTADSEVEIPDSYDDMPDWVDQHLVGRLILHPRSFKGINDQRRRFEDIKLVYRALLLLADDYRNMKMGIDGAKSALDRKLKETGLELRGSITPSRAGEQGDTYVVKYPLKSGQRRLLDFHLCKGKSHDPRYCLRIYFFWDEENNRVVVGWLPTHLDTRAT